MSKDLLIIFGIVGIFVAGGIFTVKHVTTNGDVPERVVQAATYERFELVSAQAINSVSPPYRVSILRDREAKVNYMLVSRGESVAIIPLVESK